MWSHYLPPGADGDDPRISPLRAPDLRGLPPAVLVLAGHDPLRDEGLLYAERLRADAVEVELVEFREMVHGFFSLGAEVDAAGQARDLVALSLRRAFSGLSPGSLVAEATEARAVLPARGRVDEDAR